MGGSFVWGSAHENIGQSSPIRGETGGVGNQEMVERGKMCFHKCKMEEEGKGGGAEGGGAEGGGAEEEFGEGG